MRPKMGWPSPSTRILPLRLRLNPTPEHERPVLRVVKAQRVHILLPPPVKDRPTDIAVGADLNNPTVPPLAHAAAEGVDVGEVQILVGLVQDEAPGALAVLAPLGAGVGSGWRCGFSILR